MSVSKSDAPVAMAAELTEHAGTRDRLCARVLAVLERLGLAAEGARAKSAKA